MDVSELYALKICTPILCEKLVETEIVVRLYSCEILTDFMMQEIRETKTTYKRNEEMINFLKKTDVRDAFTKFVQILRETGYVNLAGNLVELKIQAQASPPVEILRATGRDEGQLRDVKLNLMEFYKSNFKAFSPVSFCRLLDFDIDFVELSLGRKDGESLEDHCNVISGCFQETKIVVVEGKAGSGKTALARRICYEWGMGKWDKFDLVLFAFFRSHHGKTYDTVKELVEDSMQSYLAPEQYEKLRMLLANELSYSFLYVLDGYDEAQPGQIERLDRALVDLDNPCPQIPGRLLVLTRPDASFDLEDCPPRYGKVNLFGFGNQEQKYRFIEAHFKTHEERESQIIKVKEKLYTFPILNYLSSTPLYLFFICLVHEKLQKGTLREMFDAIIWWLLDRYQTKNQRINVPKCFGFENNFSRYKDLCNCIEDNWQDFSQIHLLGHFSLHMETGMEKGIQTTKVLFKKKDIFDFGLNDQIILSGFLVSEVEEGHMNPRQVYAFPHRQLQEFFAIRYCIYWQETQTCPHCDRIDELSDIDCGLIPGGGEELNLLFEAFFKMRSLKNVTLSNMWYPDDDNTESSERTGASCMILPSALSSVKFFLSKINFEDSCAMAKLLLRLTNVPNLTLSFEKCHISFVAMATLLSHSFDFKQSKQYCFSKRLLGFCDTGGKYKGSDNRANIAWKSCTIASLTKNDNSPSEDQVAIKGCLELLNGKLSQAGHCVLTWDFNNKAYLMADLLPKFVKNLHLGGSWWVFENDLHNFLCQGNIPMQMNEWTEKAGFRPSDQSPSEEDRLTRIPVHATLRIPYLQSCTSLLFICTDFSASSPHEPICTSIKGTEIGLVNITDCRFSLASWLSMVEWIAKSESIGGLIVSSPELPTDPASFTACFVELQRCQKLEMLQFIFQREMPNNVDLTPTLALLAQNIKHLRRMFLYGSFGELLHPESKSIIEFAGKKRTSHFTLSILEQ